jgi:hypothetical protein
MMRRDGVIRLKAVTVVLVALGLCAARLAAQDGRRWQDVRSEGGGVVAIDTTSVTPLGDSTYRVWERSASRTPGQGGVLARVDFDCRLRLTRVVAVALPGFAPTPASESDREWVEILPGSSYEAEWRQVCATGGLVSGPR